MTRTTHTDERGTQWFIDRDETGKIVGEAKNELLADGTRIYSQRSMRMPVGVWTSFVETPTKV